MNFITHWSLSFALVDCVNTRTCALLSYLSQHSSRHIQTCLQPHLRRWITPWTLKTHCCLYWHMRHSSKTCKNTERWRLGYALVYFLIPRSFTAVYCVCIASLLRGSLNQPAYFALISWFVVVGLLGFFRAILLLHFFKAAKPWLILL